MNSEMKIPRKSRELKRSRLRNAYRMNLETEYNSGKSVLQLIELKMYAELTRNRKCKKLGIKSLSDNKTGQGQVDSTTTTLTISALQTEFENASVDSEKPTVGYATRANYNRYYNLLQPQQRFTDDEMARGGFMNLMFNGVPMISDSHCPTNHLFFLNEKHLWLFYHPERNISAEPYQKPINQQVKVSRILWMGAYGSSNNRYHAKFSALAA